MARTKNNIETIQITVATTKTIHNYLEMITESGLYGKNVADTASQMLAEIMREKLSDDKNSSVFDKSYFSKKK